MTTKIQIKRGEANGVSPTGLSPGELAVEMGTPTKLWVGVPTALDLSGQKLLLDTSAGGVDAYTKVESDAKYVELAGDSMSGALHILNGAAGDGVRLAGVLGQAQLWATGPSPDVAVVMSSKGWGGWTIYTNDFQRMAFGVGATGLATDTFVNVYPGIGHSQIVNNPQANPIIFNSPIDATIDCGVW